MRLFWKIIVTSADNQWRVTDGSSADKQTKTFVKKCTYIVKLIFTYFSELPFKLFLLSCGQNIREINSFLTHCYFPRKGTPASHNVIERSNLCIYISCSLSHCDIAEL